MIDFNISDRLKRIAGLITKNDTVADIGTDHGYLPIFLVKEKKAGKVIACDIREKPLGRARQNALDLGVGSLIDFRISDGLEGLNPGEADTLIICGMGGHAIRKILTNGLESGKISIGTDCVLSPHTDRESLSEFLYENGFRINDEILLHEKAAYYILWKCTFDGVKRAASPEVHAYGELLIQKQDEALKSYLQREEELLLRIIKKLKALPGDKKNKRLSEVMERLKMNKKIRWF